MRQRGDYDALWQEAYAEARRLGARPNVARVYAKQTVVHARAERDGVELPGGRTTQAYR